jgi:hypothetical protein
MLSCTHDVAPPLVKLSDAIRHASLLSNLLLNDSSNFGPGEVTPCQIKNHVQRNFATPILYAIDIFKNYKFFFSTYITIDNIFLYIFLKFFSHLHFF